MIIIIIIIIIIIWLSAAIKKWSHFHVHKSTKAILVEDYCPDINNSCLSIPDYDNFRKYPVLIIYFTQKCPYSGFMSTKQLTQMKPCFQNLLQKRDLLI